MKKYLLIILLTLSPIILFLLIALTILKVSQVEGSFPIAPFTSDHSTVELIKKEKCNFNGLFCSNALVISEKISVWRNKIDIGDLIIVTNSNKYIDSLCLLIKQNKNTSFVYCPTERALDEYYITRIDNIYEVFNKDVVSKVFFPSFSDTSITLVKEFIKQIYEKYPSISKQ